jgi:hypothetical protein
MKLLIMQFLPNSYHPPRPKYTPQHPCLKHPQSKRRKQSYPCTQLSKHQIMKTHGGLEVQFLHSQLWHQMELSGQLHAPVALLPGKDPPVLIVYEAGWAPGSA